MPLPKERLKGDSWTSRFAAARAALPAPGARDNARPAYSTRVIEVYDGSQAGELGIRPGDMAIAIDDRPILGIRSFGDLRTQGRQTLRLWSPDKGVTTLDIKPGPLGVRMQETWLPDVAYRQSGERDPKWDDLVLVAAATWDKDEFLAETALARAAQAGYRGWLTPALMARLCEVNGRHREALDFGWFAKDRIPPEQARPLFVGIVSSALLCGQIEWAVKQIDEWKAYDILLLSWDPSEVRRRLQAAGAGDGSLPTPCQAAAHLPWSDLETLDESGDCITGHLHPDGESTFEIAVGRYSQIFLGPALHNPALAVDFHFAATPPENKDKPAHGRFRLVDVAGGAEEELASLDVYPMSKVQVIAPGYPLLEMNGGSLLRDDSVRVEIAIRGPWCEMRMNGRQVFLGTVPHRPDRSVACGLELHAVTGTFTRLTWTEIEPAPPAPKASAPLAAEETALRVPSAPSDPTLAWYHESMVGGYLRQGRRSATWDQAAVEALAGAARLFRAPAELADAWDVFAASRKAVEAGCDDPLVVYVHSWMHQIFVDFYGHAVTRWQRLAAQGMEKMDYAPVWRCMALATAAGNGIGSRLVERRDKAKTFLAKALALLPAALADRRTPNAYLLTILKQLIKTGQVTDGSPLPMLDRLHAMAEASRPGSAVGPALKGDVYVEYAWEARGSGWASEVTEEGWKRFRERLRTAADAYGEAWKREPDDPAAPTGMLQVALGHDKVREQVAEWFGRAIKADRENIDACHYLMCFLRPRWHGDFNLLLAFGQRCFEMGVEEPSRPALMLMRVKAQEAVIEDLTRSAKEGAAELTKGAYWKRPEVWAEIRDTFAQILKGYPDSVYYRSSYALFAGKCGQWAVSREQFNKLGDRLGVAVFGGVHAAYGARREAELKAGGAGVK